MANEADDVRDPDTSGYLGKDSIRQTAENAEIAANTSAIGPGSDGDDEERSAESSENAETSGDDEQQGAETGEDSADSGGTDDASAPADPEEATGDYDVAEGLESDDSSETSALGRCIEDAHEAARKAGFAVGGG